MRVCLQLFEMQVERVLEYTDLEIELETKNAKPPPANWPKSGAIVLENLQMRYQDDQPTVLRGLSLSIPARAKVAIVGRTGSGNSSESLFFSLKIEIALTFVSNSTAQAKAHWPCACCDSTKRLGL